MEEKVLRNLLELYKSKGISFEHLLENEVFKELPTENKIRLIKAHASEISDGIKFDSGDVKYLLKVIGSVGIAGVMLAKAYAATKSTSGGNPLLAFSMAAGSSIPLKTAFSNIKSFKQDMNRKNISRNYLSTPTDSNAIKLMATLTNLRIKKGL